MLPYSQNLQTFNKISEKSQGYQSMGPKYVTGKTNIPTAELLWRQFSQKS